MSILPQRRVLVVSHEHAPCPGIGGTRWTSMVRYLREQGYLVTIVASNAWGTLPDDAENGVIRVFDLRGSRPVRRLLGRGKVRVAGDINLVEPPPSVLLTKVFVPEISLVAWLPGLAVTLRRLLSRECFDCLVTTSPPESSHLAGLLLGPRRPAWVADFRDGWNFEPWRERFPTALQRGLDRWLERRVAAAADVCVGATKPIAEDLAERLGACAALVPNGWDPAIVPSPSAGSARRDRDGLRLVYTGTLIGPRRPDIRPLFTALRVAAEKSPQQLRLVHAGRLTSEEKKIIASTGAAELVEHVGTVDRADSLALQRSADALVLLTSRSSSEASGKLFEYLAAGRPVIALAAGNEAERIVRETNAGITVPPDDEEAIAAAFASAAAGELERAYAPRGLEEFTYPGPALRMAELVEEAIERRG